MKITTEHVQYPSGLPARGVAVDVYARGTNTRPVLYADDQGTVVRANPLTTDAGGNVWFYIPEGSYDFEVAGITIPFDSDADTEADFEYHQSSPSAQWTIHHNLNDIREPVVILDSDPDSPVYTDVEFPDKNTCIVTLPTPATGRAYF